MNQEFSRGKCCHNVEAETSVAKRADCATCVAPSRTYFPGTEEDRLHYARARHWPRTKKGGLRPAFVVFVKLDGCAMFRQDVLRSGSIPPLHELAVGLQFEVQQDARNDDRQQRQQQHHRVDVELWLLVLSRPLCGHCHLA